MCSTHSPCVEWPAATHLFQTEDNFLNRNRIVIRDVIKMEKPPVRIKQLLCIACGLGCLRGLIMHDMEMFFLRGLL